MNDEGLLWIALIPLSRGPHHIISSLDRRDVAKIIIAEEQNTLIQVVCWTLALKSLNEWVDINRYYTVRRGRNFIQPGDTTLVESTYVNNHLPQWPQIKVDQFQPVSRRWLTFMGRNEIDESAQFNWMKIVVIFIFWFMTYVLHKHVVRLNLPWHEELLYEHIFPVSLPYLLLCQMKNGSPAGWPTIINPYYFAY